MSEAMIVLLVEAGLIGLLIWYTSRQRNKAMDPAREHRPKQSVQELQRLQELRARHLNAPLSELARPRCFSDIVGQQEGIRALMAALCGPNPQHVLIYGPPGVGKTCAARLVLEEAKKCADSPFNEHSKFIEMDATCIRFDERAIADPLLGSVHDPIYQGAGALGSRGVPQPKPGAVTRAHCGVLFLDEIGELHPMQMNKLLKVLEDRCVHFESAYYAPDNTAIPQHIHDIFQNGLPADFRLVGATTRRPEELPPALRSRCVELHFRPLNRPELSQVAAGAAERAGYGIEAAALEQCARHSMSGRDAVNIIQLASGLAHNEQRRTITEADVRWIARNCNYTPCIAKHLAEKPRVGVANLLAVSGMGGVAMEIECTLKKSRTPALVLGGIVEEEELDAQSRRLRRKSTARGSVENVLCAISAYSGIDFSEYEVRFNIPGGMPADGPSAGIAVAIALWSAVTDTPPLPLLAATGEVTIHGDVRPVGGVREKIEAAIEAGAERILLPWENYDPEFSAFPCEILPVATVADVLAIAFFKKVSQQIHEISAVPVCTN